MRVIHWIQHHKELGNLSTNTGSRLIKVLINSGITYIHNVDENLRKYKGCGAKTWKLFCFLTDSRMFEHWADVGRGFSRLLKENYDYQKKVMELTIENRELKKSLAKEQHYNDPTNYESLRKKLTQDN